MSKFTVVACVAVFALGAAAGRLSAPTPAMASEQSAMSSTYELTLKAAPMPVQSFGAV
jgi:hypothetical protein